jgi:hypothetical protein
VSEAHLEIWFPSPHEASVFVETAATGPEREVTEVRLFAAFAARQVVNLRADGQVLARALAEIEHLEEGADIPRRIGETRLVPPTPARGRKGFEAQLRVREALPFIRLQSRGFGLRGLGVGFYGPTATLALLLHLLHHHSREGRCVLIETAQNIGGLGLAGRIGMTTQARAAAAAVSGAVATLQEAHAAEWR